MNKQSTPEIIRKAVQDLKRGDHVICPVPGYADGIVWQVVATMPYVDGDEAERLALMLSPVVGGVPTSVHLAKGWTVDLASEEQVAAAVAERGREDVIRDLRRLIELIRDERLTIKVYSGPNITIGLADGEVTRLAERLAADTTEWGKTERRLEWPARGSYGQVSVSFHGKPAAEPVYRVDITDGVPYVGPLHGPMDGYVVGLCGHRVAGTEWRAGLRVCERCPSWSGPVTVAAPASAEQVADAVLDSLARYVNVDDWSPNVAVDLTAGTMEVTEDFSGDVIARGTVTRPDVTAPAGE